MAVHLSFLLILGGVTGIHSVTTVSKVSVKAGESISIPCLYNSQYRDNVKYLCKGYHYNSCTYEIKTNQKSSSKFSILDDKNKGIFTVTIRDLTDQDTDYWCVVEINGGPDVREYFQLSVTRGVPSLRVDQQQIAASEGDEITINCYSSNSGESKWCRLGSTCVTGQSGSIDGTSVTIDTRVSNRFIVTMSGLRTESSGWYWCAKGDLQMPVHLTVTEATTTTRRLTTFSPTSEYVTHTSVFSTAMYSTSSLTNVSSPSESETVTADVLGFIIPLILLVLILLVALFIWFMFKRDKLTKVESSATTMAEEEEMYVNVMFEKKTSKNRPDAEMGDDGDVIYSSVVTVGRQNQQKVELNAEDVTYSMVTRHQ